MKRSPSSSSCSESSSSCIESNDAVLHQQQQPDELQPKIKRVRAKKNQKQKNSQINNNNNNNNATKRSSIYRGVTRHRWTGRYEAHLWDKSTWNSIQNKRGRQIYLGAYDSEEAAARTYDLAALKYWGSCTILNFPIETYRKEVEEMQKLSKEEYLASLRRQSSGFSRGVSKYRGVARHHHNGRWEARIGRVLGNKYLYLGTYSTQEEAAAAYDMAAIEYRGSNAVTNFDISNYIDIVKKQKPKPASQIKLETPRDRIEEQPKNELLKQEISEEGSTDEKQHETIKHELFKQETTDEYTDEKLLEMIKQETPEELIEEQQPLELMHENHQQYQEDENSLLKTNVSDLNFGSSMETETAVVMDPEDHHEHPWDLCLDIGFNSLDIPFDERHSELPDLLNDIEFEDNIDLIFDGAAYEIDLNQDSISGNTSCSSLEADTLVVKVEKGHEATGSSPSLSPLSTMSSVSGEV